jgi:membrane-bound transcription factor site-1 protease
LAGLAGQPLDEAHQVNASGAPQQQQQPHSAKGAYIVRFHEYRMAADHHAALQLALPAAGWQWGERHDLAMRFPTDFAVVPLGQRPAAALTAVLAALPAVKGVHPERMLTRGLKQLRSEGVDNEAAAADAPAPSSQFEDGGGGGEAACVRKRAGRLQTRPTFSLEENA